MAGNTPSKKGSKSRHSRISGDPEEVLGHQGLDSRLRGRDKKNEGGGYSNMSDNRL
jgi:hypothetical protein